MIFNSLTYLLLLLVVVLFYWHLSTKLRLGMIFISSLTFYAFWKIEFVPVMLFSVLVDYLVSLRIPNANQRLKKKLLLLSLITNLGLLFYFKYLIFFADNAIGLLNIFGLAIDPIALKIILPLGISFYTFQTISYTIDVYRGVIKPEKNFLLYACYVTFFPQLIAGPVLRAGEVIHQLASRPIFSFEFISLGIKRIIYGLFLKVVIADNISPLVDSGFLIPIELMSAFDVWTLAFLFGFQIYFDFSAYSHIAIGSAKLLGITFPENFNFPYMADSPKDFWKRWHISLSSWIRDYLYFPLAGIKIQNNSLGGLEQAVTVDRKNKALFTSWAIMGLWHGASWTFVLWGIYHASVIYIFRLIPNSLKINNETVSTFIGTAITLPVMMIGWIPFRANNIEDTFAMWLKIINPSSYMESLGMRENTYLVAALLVIAFFLINYTKEVLAPYMKTIAPRILVIFETIIFTVAISLIIIFLRPISQFIYFQF